MWFAKEIKRSLGIKKYIKNIKICQVGPIKKGLPEGLKKERELSLTKELINR